VKNLHTKIVNSGDEGHELEVAIDLRLNVAELIHYAPTHSKHVKVTLVFATFHQLQRFPQSLLKTVQRFLCRRQPRHLRRFQRHQQVPYHPHLLHHALAVPAVRTGVMRR